MTLRNLIVPKHLLSQLETEASAAFPKECCGLIEGVRHSDSVEVLALHPTRNCAVAGGRFEIAPADRIRLARDLRGADREIVGCYHSHPYGSAEASERDRACAAEANFIWLLAAVPARSEICVRAFAFDGERFQPMDIREPHADRRFAA